MGLAEHDFKRAAQAVLARHGESAAISVRRYVMMLRRDNRHDLAEYWERIADWIEAIKPRSIH
jgi:hypothetical protein